MSVSEADRYQHYDGYHIRQSFIYLFHREIGSCRDIQVENIESAEQH